MRTALLAGATGLVGKQLLTLLLDDSAYKIIKVISRRGLTFTHEKIENIVIDFNALHTVSEAVFHVDDVFCCLGTTIAQAGSKEAFKKVDFEYPLQIAQRAKAAGASQYLLVSALGACKDSCIFYNAVKGQVEEAIGILQYHTTHVFRPSLLLGDRQEKRTGERLAAVVSKYLNFLIPQKYKPVNAYSVAQAMEYWAKQEKMGFFIHESSEIGKTLKF